MNSLFKLLLIASVLALLVAFPVDAKKKADSKEEKAEEHKAEAAGEVNEHSSHPAEHNVDKEDDQEHQRDDGHTERTEDDLEQHKEDVEHDDEHDTISELVNLAEPPSSEATEAEHENAHAEEEHDHKHVDHEEDNHELKDKLKCCFISLQKPLSASSRCSCSHWLKHALRNSIFFRPFYKLIRKSLSALPQMGHHHDDNEGNGDTDEEEEEEESVKRSSLRELGVFDGGYLGSGYYGGYPGYWGGYPGYYGYSGMVGSPGIGFGMYI